MEHQTMKRTQLQAKHTRVATLTVKKVALRTTTRGLPRTRRHRRTSPILTFLTGTSRVVVEMKRRRPAPSNRRLMVAYRISQLATVKHRAAPAA